MIDEALIKRIKPGATVRVLERVKEKDKERLSQFEGIVLARKHGSEPGASFTVRATVAGVGMEKVYPIYSPMIARLEILSSPRKVHRAKLYYLRTLSRKEIRQKLGTSDIKHTQQTKHIDTKPKEQKAAA